MSCPDCFTGHVHAGTPTGSEITLAGLPTYVSRPQNGGEPKGVVLFIPDIFGWAFVNSRLLCDAYAEKGGFVVYLPDLMGGRAPPFELSALIDKIKNPASWTITLLWKPIWVFQAASLLIPFFATNRQSVVLSRITNIITAIRASPDNSALKVGTAGFCWGGKYVFLLAHDKPSSRISVNGSLQPLIDCAFTAHPSMLSVPADVENVRQPMSVAVGDTDMATSTEDIRTMETILKKKGEDHEVVILDGAKHGFAVRLDPKDELQNKYADVAEKQAIAWFTKWLAK